MPGGRRRSGCGSGQTRTEASGRRGPSEGRGLLGPGAVSSDLPGRLQRQELRRDISRVPPETEQVSNLRPGREPLGSTVSMPGGLDTWAQLWASPERNEKGFPADGKTPEHLQTGREF